MILFLRIYHFTMILIYDKTFPQMHLYGGGFIDEDNYLTCKIDRVFKDVFLDSNDLSLLQGLLESILKVEIHKIEIQNSELNEGNAFFRRKYLDALLDTNEGVINIEINTSVDDYLRERNFAFIMRAFTNHTLRL